MSTQSKSKPRRKAAGRVAAPAVIFALLSVLLAMGFERIGLLGGVASALRGGYARMGFAALAPVAWPVVWAALALAALALAWAVLDSPQLWRRVVLGVGALVITAAWSPVLATLGYDLPVAPLLLGIGWAWFCATTYAQQHRMPCDPAAPAHS
jgi:hypothetical protein